MKTYTYKEVVSNYAWDKTSDKVMLVENIAWAAITAAVKSGAEGVYDVAIDVVPNFAEGEEESKVVTVEVYYGSDDMRRL